MDVKRFYETYYSGRNGNPEFEKLTDKQLEAIIASVEFQYWKTRK